VIAIIAILAAILFPVFARAREKARQSSCLSNTKQIGLALMMYIQDFDETFPGFRWDMDGDGSSKRCHGWYDSLKPYTKNEQIFICPSGKYEATYCRSGLPNAEGFFGRVMPCSYGVAQNSSAFVSGTGGRHSPWNYTPPGPILAAIDAPSETIAMFESTSDYMGRVEFIGFNEDGSVIPMDERGRVGRIHYRHNGQMNILYCDGHAKTHGQFGSWDPFLID
ncbi:MAG: DUF1559 domain-containing protein, partial [Armatimonadota bacterium]